MLLLYQIVNMGIVIGMQWLFRLLRKVLKQKSYPGIIRLRELTMRSPLKNKNSTSQYTNSTHKTKNRIVSIGMKQVTAKSCVLEPSFPGVGNRKVVAWRYVSVSQRYGCPRSEVGSAW